MSKRQPQGKRNGRTERAVSAGGIVVRADNGALEVVICGRDGDGVWGLPKGTPEAGETLENTALREVSEETGLEVRLGNKVGVVEYWFVADNIRFHKHVHYYLMEATGGDTSLHDQEYDRVEWRHVDDAMRTLTFRNEKNIVSKAREMIEEK